MEVENSARIPAFLQLWCRLAAAAPILLLAWELPYATGSALKRKKKIYKQEAGDTEGLLYLGGGSPQSPASFQSPLSFDTPQS